MTYQANNKLARACTRPMDWRDERFRESDALRRVFEGVVAKCIAAGLVGGEAFSVDASLIKADVDKNKRMPGDQPITWPKAAEASRAVREYLTALDAARSNEADDDRDSDGSSSSGSRSKPAKEVSLTDPQAAWVTWSGVDPFFAYDANYLIDNKAHVRLHPKSGARADIPPLHIRAKRRHAGYFDSTFTCCSTMPGSMNAKVEPWPGSDSAQILPPCISMMRFDMARPKPVPPFLRVIALSACWNC